VGCIMSHQLNCKTPSSTYQMHMHVLHGSGHLRRCHSSWCHPHAAALQEGWEVDAAQTLVTVKTSPTPPMDQAIAQQGLQKLAEFVVHLETNA
jgi:hypothetical protein